MAQEKPLSLEALRKELAKADEKTFALLRERYAADGRKGVMAAFDQNEKRLRKEADERKRVDGLYRFEEELAASMGGGLICGLDEVGRGPVAGPLAVGAVVLPRCPQLFGLDDSKKLSAKKREKLASRIEDAALAACVCFVEPSEIDELGMSACLRKAFASAVFQIEAQGITPDVILLDGNPLHFDKREVNVVKGDAQCASIAAASIVAKVRRDALMSEYARIYPEYHLDSCKGYASAEHIQAIRTYGLSPIHRVTFCSGFVQPEQLSLF